MAAGSLPFFLPLTAARFGTLRITGRFVIKVLEQQVLQKQALTLSQRQSLEVLAMSTVELREFLDREQLENPLLEVEPPRDPEGDRLVDIAQWLQSGPPRVENGVYQEEGTSRREPSNHGRTYREDLKEQLYSLGGDGEKLRLAEKLVDLIDGRGFLPYTDLELCRLLGCPPAACQSALRTLSALEPFGVGSRDLGEFLIRQLAQKRLLSPALTEICSSFLPLLAEGNYREISAALGLELPVVRQCARLIATLRPSPLTGSQEGGPAQYILPDVVIRRGEKGLFPVVNDRYCGQVRISGYYKSYLQGAGSPEVRDYLREKIQRARWVVAAVEQRQKTLSQIAEELIRRQEAFFSGGDLSALTLRQTAEKLGVHESTVSRAVSGKYLQCSRGTFPMKYFFSAGVKARKEGLSAMGRESVKERLLRIIREEDPEKPLSDEAIRARLREEGLELSRRTVAKYRAECGIRPASDRGRSLMPILDGMCEWGEKNR